MHKDLIKFVIDGMNVTRFHTRATVKKNTVGHHSAGVGVFCMLLKHMNPSANLLQAALIHDLAENLCGDLPSPVKDHLDIKEAFDDMEEEILEDMGLGIFLDKEDIRTLRIADCLDGASFCIQEARLGNRQLMDIYDRYMVYVSLLGPFNDTELEIIHQVKEYGYERK